VIGGREHPFAALCDLLPADVSWGDSLTPDIARHIVIAARAALTAEKVAAEPISDDHAATLWRLARMTDAAAWTAELRKAVAPQQPTQSAEQDEAAAYLVRGLDGYNEEYASVWIKRANADAAAAAIFRASITPLVVPSAASTQSTATQPAQTEVAAFEAWASENGLNPKIYTSKLNPGGAYGWAMKAWQARALLAAQPVSGADK
jgi:hypothetical protein